MLIDAHKMPALLALIKGDPLLNVAGAYFPAWLACMAVGVVGTWGLLRLAQRRGIHEALLPAPLMLTALFVGLTCATWLLVFAVR